MDKSATTDKDAPKDTATRDQRLEEMKARLLALPGQVSLRPDDLDAHLEYLEGSEDLAGAARLIVDSGYGIRR